MPEHTTLILDLTQQVATVQGSLNTLLAASGRAEEDRKEIKDQVRRISDKFEEQVQRADKKIDEQVLLINARLVVLEIAKAKVEGGVMAVRLMWVALAAVVCAASSWVAQRFGPA